MLFGVLPCSYGQAAPMRPLQASRRLGEPPAAAPRGRSGTGGKGGARRSSRPDQPQRPQRRTTKVPKPQQVPLGWPTDLSDGTEEMEAAME